jgi:hypothetical protein
LELSFTKNLRETGLNNLLTHTYPFPPLILLLLTAPLEVSSLQKKVFGKEILEEYLSSLCPLPKVTPMPADIEVFAN